MTKMTQAQRTAILDAHGRHLKRIGHGGVSADVRTVKVLRREGFVSTVGPTFDKPTRAGLIAAGVNLDKLHAKALTEWTVRDNDPRDDAVRAEAARYNMRGGRGDARLWASEIMRNAAHAEALAEYREVTRAARQADSASYQRELARGLGLNVKRNPTPRQSLDITGARCLRTDAHEPHRIIGSFRGSCSGIEQNEEAAR